jgi:hypothetical protein
VRVTVKHRSVAGVVPPFARYSPANTGTSVATSGSIVGQVQHARGELAESPSCRAADRGAAWGYLRASGWGGGASRRTP